MYLPNLLPTTTFNGNNCAFESKQSPLVWFFDLKSVVGFDVLLAYLVIFSRDAYGTLGFFVSGSSSLFSSA